jgi:hypothetical protein
MATGDYPRHSLERALRIPRGILEQNAGKECTDQEAARYIKVKYNKGPFNVELVSATKYGLLERPSKGHVALTDIARRVLKPQSPDDERNGLREAALKAPVISAVYAHYRGESLPEATFFDNALTDKFAVPAAKLNEFKDIFFETLTYAKLIVETDGKRMLTDVSDQPSAEAATKESAKKLERSVRVEKADTVFVMMPFQEPLGAYYEKLYKPAIENAGLTPVRADSDIFGSGKIVDQIWSGINNAKVLVAELTDRNPNVFYELGLAHALQKPVVLVSSNQGDVPFDLKHVRVIFYDRSDPFWGQKLIEKVKENILSALKDPNEAILFSK